MSRYRHSRLAEREQLASLRAYGPSWNAIGCRPEPSASTIAREVRRNVLSESGYQLFHVHGWYPMRRQRSTIPESGK